MYYTLIFALGLAFILVPIAFGVRFAVFFLDAYHSQVYWAGALIMVLMGILTLKPFLRFPKIFKMQPRKKMQVNTASVFSLGVVSGLTSACCAPVLFAAVTLTTLSPSLLQAIVVTSAYVLGIVTPLFVMSVFYARLSFKLSDKNRTEISRIFKLIGGAIFIATGMLIGILNYLGDIQMAQMEPYSRSVRLAVFAMAKYFNNPAVDSLTFAIVLFIFFILLSRGVKELSLPDSD